MDANDLISRWNSLDSERSAVKAKVQEIMEYCLPGRATVAVQRAEGHNVRELFDSTAETACQRFATGMYNFMWSPARRNFLLRPPIEEGPGSGDVWRPLLAISETIQDEMGSSNFEEAFYEIAQDWGTAGLATMEPSRGLTSLYEFAAYPFEQIVFAENSRGRVDTVLRRTGMTARQIVQEFGPGPQAVGKTIWDAYSANDGRDRDKVFEILHGAIPRAEYSAGARDVLNMPVASVWVAVTDRILLRESGWPEQRYLVSRFAKASGEKHGRSPARMCLPDVKMVNQIEQSVIEGAEQVVRPPILNPDGAALIPDKRGRIVYKPGSILNYRSNPMAPGLRPEPFPSGARVDFGAEYAESKRQIIKSAFFNDLFLILGDEKRRTATEVRSILAEKLAMLGPAFGRIKVEMFDPMIRVLLSILAERPDLLRGIPLGYLQLSNIRYISTLAIAMEYAELSLIEDAMMFLSPLGELDPTIFDNLSFDEITRGFLEKMAWPVRWLKSRDEVKALREARMQYQAQQLQQALAQQQIDQAWQRTKRPEPGSPADELLNRRAA